MLRLGGSIQTLIREVTQIRSLTNTLTKQIRKR